MFASNLEEHEASTGYYVNEVETCLLPQGPGCIKPAIKVLTYVGHLRIRYGYTYRCCIKHT